MSENQWLKEGEKTKITPYVKKIAESIRGNDLELIGNISKFVGSLNAKKWPHWRELPDFRVGSADKLLKRKILYGCIEVGTVFRALCIARGIPAIFVETLRKKWMGSKPDPKNPRMIEGHIFIDICVKGKWYTINPGSPSWLHKHQDYSIKMPNLGKYEVIGRGLDSIDLGFSDMMVFRTWIVKKFNMPHLIDYTVR